MKGWGGPRGPGTGFNWATENGITGQQEKRMAKFGTVTEKSVNVLLLTVPSDSPERSQCHGLSHHNSVSKPGNLKTTQWTDGRYGRHGLPRWLGGETCACRAGYAGDTGSISGLGRSLGGNGNLLCYCWQEIPWTEEPRGWGEVGFSSWGHKETWLSDWVRLCTHTHTHTQTHTHTHSQQSAFHCAAVFYIRRQGIEAMDQGTSNIFSWVW